MQLTTSVGDDVYAFCRMLAIEVRQKQGNRLLVGIEKKIKIITVIIIVIIIILIIM